MKKKLTYEQLSHRYVELLDLIKLTVDYVPKKRLPEIQKRLKELLQDPPASSGRNETPRSRP